jgi:hypothetical protein
MEHRHEKGGAMIASASYEPANVSSSGLGRGARAGARVILRAWLLTALIDGLWAVVLTLAYGRSQAKLWQGIASTAFGKAMLDAGAPAVVLGIIMHISVALFWTLVLWILLGRWRGLSEVLASPLGALKVAAFYGPMIWLVMSAVVVPLLTRTPFAPTWRWWIQAAGHVVFVGLPMALVMRQEHVDRR